MSQMPLQLGFWLGFIFCLGDTQERFERPKRQGPSSCGLGTEEQALADKTVVTAQLGMSSSTHGLCIVVAAIVVAVVTASSFPLESGSRSQLW